MRWKGYRRVRGQVCKRIEGRIHALGLADAAAYRSFLERNRTEWDVLDGLCRVTISRFYRDGAVFRTLEREVLPGLCEDVRREGAGSLRCWSIGCASGEEPYTLAILWDLVIGPLFPGLKLSIAATDADRTMLERAQEGCYAPASIRELPPDWKTRAFARERTVFCIRPEEREKVVFLEQDVRFAEPDGRFHLVLCRNLAFTYFDGELQKEILDKIQSKLHHDGVLVVGLHETVPRDQAAFLPWSGCTAIYRKR
jgi:chemotaxis protein methyltransferase CheR